MAHPNSLVNLDPRPQAAAKEGDRTQVLITLPVAAVEFLDQLVTEAKAVRKSTGKGHPKKIGRGDIISGLLDYLAISQANPSQIIPELARLMALGLLE